MIQTLLVAHVLTTIVIAASGSRLGRGVFALAVLPTGATAVYSLVALIDDRTDSWTIEWAPDLDLVLTLEMSPVAGMLSLLVSGIGALVMIYAAGYFSAGAAGLSRFCATLLAFSTAMLGLVWSDSVWSLFVFWELTSITSFLLVGHKNVDASVRMAARRALLITAAGGLVLLAGLLVLVDQTGTVRLSEMEPPSGAGATLAVVLLVIAAATKSAQVPFHVWLPGAMAAPTPVSAYLHSATMVKAGIVLLALAGPVLRDVDIWLPLGATVGLLTMFWGAIGALRHVDAKLILAWGTVSQLGLMVTLLSIGSGKATFAAVSIVLAHAIFKAALFMVVGEIDVRTGTRDVRELSGLWRSMPLATAVAVVSGVSMAGVPPTLGFAAKEAAVEAGLGMTGLEKTLVLGGIVLGSVLTVAYTTRFLWATFGDGPGEPTEVGAPRPAMAVPSTILGVLTLLGYVVMDLANDLVRPAAVQLDKKAEVYSLLQWPGLTDAFVISMCIVVAGVVVGAALAKRTDLVPAPIGAGMVDRFVVNLLRGAGHVTARVQHGSLPVYVLTMAIVATIAALPLVDEFEPEIVEFADSPLQLVIAGIVAITMFGALRIGSRLGAALALGAVGIGVSALFKVHGAPDLVLTQLLVETVVVVGFVIGLGSLRSRFPSTGATWRSLRMFVSVALGMGVALALFASGAQEPTNRITEQLVAESVSEGGGNNVVNVVLTDVRALDTFGEVLVLAVVAVGIVALSKVGRGGGRVAS